MNELQLMNRECPVCNSESTSSDNEVRAKTDAATASRLEIEAKWEGFHSKTCFFTYARCRNCSTLFNPTYFSEQTIGFLYSSIADNTSGAPITTHNKTQSNYTKILSRRNLESGPVVEVGPDLGLATKSLIEKGIATSALFVEKNQGAYGALRELEDLVPISIVNDVSELPIGINATTGLLIHVLDHVIVPMSTLSKVHQSMASGGAVLIVVHNEKSILRKFMGGLWPPFRMQHPHLFSKQSLEQLLLRAGFTDIEIKKSTNYMPLRHAYNLGASSLGLPKNFARLIPNVEVPLKLGNLVAVATKP